MKKIISIITIITMIYSDECINSYNSAIDNNNYETAKKELSDCIEKNPNDYTLKLQYNNLLQLEERLKFHINKALAENNKLNAYSYLSKLKNIDSKAINNPTYLSLQNEIDTKLAQIEEEALRNLEKGRLDRVNEIMMEYYLYEPTGEKFIKIATLIDKKIDEMNIQIKKEEEEFFLRLEKSIGTVSADTITDFTTKKIAVYKSQRREAIEKNIKQDMENLDKIKNSKKIDKKILLAIEKSKENYQKALKNLTVNRFPFDKGISNFKKGEYTDAINNFSTVTREIGYGLDSISKSYMYIALCYAVQIPLKKNLNEQRHIKIEAKKNFGNAKRFNPSITVPKEYTHLQEYLT